MYRFTDPPELRTEKRMIWAATRSVMENIGFIHQTRGRKSRSRWHYFVRLLKVFAFLLKITGLYKKGYHNARDIRVKEIEFVFPNLPPAFRGFRILHLSDLHIDTIPGFTALLTARIRHLDFDICLLSGDYRKDSSGTFRHILKPIRILSEYIKAPFGTFAVLGNHDTYLMAGYEKESGMELLVNESVEIIKDDQKILITGTDDPFNFYTESASLCLETRGYPFKIALVHTTELAVTASQNKYDLYLCGHTHGGQICLKKGMPLISHQFEGKEFNHGSWKIGRMSGYTSSGAGVSGLPVRFNCPAEITIIKLFDQVEPSLD